MKTEPIIDSRDIAKLQCAKRTALVELELVLQWGEKSQE